MIFAFSFLQAVRLALPLSFLTRSALGSLNSAFNIKAHGTGFRYAASVNSDDIGVSTSDDLAVSKHRYHFIKCSSHDLSSTQ